MRLNTMANADLTVTVKHHSAYYAEVKFTDRHNDDLPFSMTSRLIAKGQHRTCVTFETPHQAQINLKSKDEIPSLWTWIIMGVYGLMGLYILFLLVLLSQVVIVRPVILLVFIVIGWIQYVAHSLANGSLDDPKFNQRKMKKLAQQRMNRLESALRETLLTAPPSAHFDELGNTYYIEEPNQTMEQS